MLEPRPRRGNRLRTIFRSATVRAMRVVLAALIALALLAGCGGDDPEQQVGELISELKQVQASGDAEKACEEVFVVQEEFQPAGEENSEREREEERSAGGEARGCESAFEQSVEQRRANLKRLDTKLAKVDLEDGKGVALVRTSATRADGSTFERDVPYDVVRTREGWRIRISPEG